MKGHCATPWVFRKRGHVNFSLTQLLIGRGHVNSYLISVNEKEHPEGGLLYTCVDDADNTLLHCPGTESARLGGEDQPKPTLPECSPAYADKCS